MIVSVKPDSVQVPLALSFLADATASAMKSRAVLFCFIVVLFCFISNRLVDFAFTVAYFFLINFLNKSFLSLTAPTFLIGDPILPPSYPRRRWNYFRVASGQKRVHNNKFESSPTSCSSNTFYDPVLIDQLSVPSSSSPEKNSLHPLAHLRPHKLLNPGLRPFHYFQLRFNGTGNLKMSIWAPSESLVQMLRYIKIKMNLYDWIWWKNLDFWWLGEAKFRLKLVNLLPAKTFHTLKPFKKAQNLNH